MKYIIVGAGPTGLTTAWLLAKYGHTVVVVDRENNIGGCHRVKRVAGLFTEHGPRVYNSSYLTFKHLLNDLDLDYDNLFVDYKYNAGTIGGKTAQDMKLKELWAFIKEYTKLVMGFNTSRFITTKQFMDDNDFSDKTRDFVDRLCRLTDGAGSERYTLHEFLGLLNYTIFYKFSQPKNANDIGLFKKWGQKLNEAGIKFILGSGVKIIKPESKIIELENGQIGKYDRLILALPPENLLEILKQSNINDSFSSKISDFKKLEQWVHRNSYDTYISITYHWSTKIKMKDKWGFPASDWGIAFINMTDYFEELDRTLISTCITKHDTVSKRIGKKPDECTEEELKWEVFNQLKEVFPDLPNPDIMMLSPNAFKEGNKWFEKDKAYMMTVDLPFIDLQSTKNPDIYSVGTHTGYALFPFTSMESAVSNAYALVNKLEPKSKDKYQIIYPYSLVGTIRKIIIVLIIVMALFYWYKKYKIG